MQSEVIISNFNRLNPFLKLIGWLQKAQGVSKITVVDNGSTYPPLLEYYESMKDITLIRGPLSLRHVVMKKYIDTLGDKESFIISDSDVVPHEDCPLDLIPKLFGLLEKYQFAIKVGPKLFLDDLPEHYPLRKHVLFQQSQILKSRSLRTCKELSEENSKKDGVILSKIGHTFSLHRNKTYFNALKICLVTLYPYVFRHVDWYEDGNNFTEEFKYYLSTANETSTWTNKMREYLKTRSNNVVQN